MNEWQNNGFVQPDFQQSLPGFGSGFGTPFGQKQKQSRPLQGRNPLQDSNPFTANPNATPVGDPARRQERLMQRQQQPFDLNQFMQHPLVQLILSSYK